MTNDPYKKILKNQKSVKKQKKSQKAIKTS